MKVNEKKFYQAVILCFAVLSLPIIVISFYNIPSADDYTFGRAMQAWIGENGYHILGMLKCAVKNSIHYYFNWQGRYSESFFASFMPEIFGCYWLWAVFLYCFFTASVLCLCRSVMKYLVGEVRLGLCIGFLTCIMIIQNIPFPVEAFFWFDGSMAYLFHHTLYIWMCALIVKYYFVSKKQTEISCLIGISVLTMFVAGGNNVTAFVSILTFCVFLGISVLIRRKKGILVPFVLSIIGFVVSYLSPGTRIRGGDSSNYTPILLTIRKCFVWTIKQYFVKWTVPTMLFFLILLTPLLLKGVSKIVSKYKFAFPFPGLAAAGVVCFLSAMSSPSFYILGEPGPGRMRNVIYVNYVLLMVVLYGYFLGWFAVRYKNAWKNLIDMSDRLPQIFRGCAAILLLVLVCIGKPGNPGLSFRAVEELVSGQAKQYFEEGMERKKIYENINILEAEVEPYSIKPELLYFDDITDDPDNWKNKGLAEFYGKDSVKLSRYDPDVDYD